MAVSLWSTKGNEISQSFITQPDATPCDHSFEKRESVQKRRCRSRVSGFVFGTGKDGQPPQAAAISVAFARLATALNLPGVSHHTLRHTGATVMVANGRLAPRRPNDWRVVDTPHG
jgi:integrase